jgi:putative transposase
VRELILRLATENPRWATSASRASYKGSGGIGHGDQKLLARRSLGPAPRRAGMTWRQFLAQQACGIVACDFLTVETVWMRRIYVPLFIVLFGLDVPRALRERRRQSPADALWQGLGRLPA